MKDYYQVIGVSRTASDSEIKRSFRRLANLYHPDKNPTREAESVFKEINEAYEVLSDPQRRIQYDQLLANPSFYRLDNAWPGQQEYRQNYRARYADPSQRSVFMQSMLRYVQLLFYFGCVWSLTLSIDFVLPSRVMKEKVITDIKQFHKILMRDHRDLLVTDKGHHFPILISELKHFPNNSEIAIYSSALFGAVIKLENYDSSFEVNNLASIYRNFSFAPILLFVSCLIGLIVRRGVEFHVNLGIVVFLLMVLNIVFLFNSFV